MDRPPVRPIAFLVLLALFAAAAVPMAVAATRSSHHTTHRAAATRSKAKAKPRTRSSASAPSRPRTPTWVAPFKTITSSDGRFTACNYNMKQEGWGAMMLFQEGRLIRVWAGLRAVSWEPGTTRLLVTEAVPDDELHWFMIDPAQGGADVDMRELPRTPVPASRSATFREWLPEGRMVFGQGIDATRRDTLATPPAKP